MATALIQIELLKCLKDDNLEAIDALFEPELLACPDLGKYACLNALELNGSFINGKITEKGLKRLQDMMATDYGALKHAFLKYQETKLKILEAKQRWLEVLNSLKAFYPDMNEVKIQAMFKSHMDSLHEYNETKDRAQEILGQLAILQNKTIKQVYEDMEIESD